MLFKLLFSLFIFAAQFGTLGYAVPRARFRRNDLKAPKLHIAGMEGEEAEDASLRQTEPLQDTNARRFARGLPPRRALSPFDGGASRVEAANKARASLRLGAPSTSLCGYIKVANATTGQCIGYVSKNFDARGEYVVDKWNFAVEVAFSAYTTGLTNLVTITDKISMYNSPAPSTRSLSPYIGASIAGYSADLGATSPNYAVLTGVSQTSRNARPQNGRSSTGLPLVESAIWTFDSRNYQLTASWMTNSAQLLPATIAYDPEDLHQISIAACPIAYHQVRPAAIAVNLYLVSSLDQQC